jgi:hypothetical protein
MSQKNGGLRKEAAVDELRQPTRIGARFLDARLSKARVGL